MTINECPRFLLCLFMSLLLTGCNLFSSDTDLNNEVLVTVSPSTTTTGEFIKATIENSTWNLILIPSCGGRPVFRIETIDQSAWTEYGFVNSPCLAHLDMGPIELSPADTVSTYFKFSKTGEYRLRLDYKYDGKERSEFTHSIIVTD